MNRLPSRVVATADPFFISLASSIFLQLSKGKRHKIKMYTLQNEIKREKSELPQAAMNKTLPQYTCPCAGQSDRDYNLGGWLQVGKPLCIAVSKIDFT